MSEKLECPYMGHMPRVSSNWSCGELGYLCDRCQQDRADARNDKLVEAITGKQLWKLDPLNPEFTGKKDMFK